MKTQRRRTFTTFLTLASLSCFAGSPTTTLAVSPESVAIGGKLFTQNWSPQNPALMGRDGLGPLFNAQSCAACHNQGGIGGAGAAEFNAKTISIESMRLVGTGKGRVNRDMVRDAITRFHPGFLRPQNGISNALPLSHHGGTSAFAESRRQFLSQIPAEFSEKGGAISPAEVRYANATPVLYSAKTAAYETTIRARLFQRNTTPLFGAGLIDQVKDRELNAIVRDQKNHPEISGRLATLASGRLGRFGWRGNVPSLLAFCDRACAAEVGLETRRMKQPLDPTVPGYRHPSHDISDSQIRAMADFVAALPRPERRMPEDSLRRVSAVRGEQLFASIGCAVCHQPNLTVAQGIYSDLLLHDMGPNSYDLNPADPYITRTTPVFRTDYDYVTTETESATMIDDTVMGTGYYGGEYSMEPGTTSTTMKTSRGTTKAKMAIPVRPNAILKPREYLFEAASTPPMTMRFVNTQSKQRSWTEEEVGDKKVVERKVGRRERTASGNDSYLVETQSKSSQRIRETKTSYVRVHMEPTYFTQEWRTPPLWGVHDSAPYWHDGRAETLLEAVTLHEGESAGTRDRFLSLSLADRNAIVEFMHTLVAPRNAPKMAE